MEILTTEAEEEIVGGLTMIGMFQVMMMAWVMKLLGQEENSESCKFHTLAYTIG